MLLSQFIQDRRSPNLATVRRRQGEAGEGSSHTGLNMALTRKKQRKRNAAHADFQLWDTLHGRAFSRINVVREERDSFPRQRT